MFFGLSGDAENKCFFYIDFTLARTFTCEIDAKLYYNYVIIKCLFRT